MTVLDASKEWRYTAPQHAAMGQLSSYDICVVLTGDTASSARSHDMAETYCPYLVHVLGDSDHFKEVYAEMSMLMNGSARGIWTNFWAGAYIMNFSDWDDVEAVLRSANYTVSTCAQDLHATNFTTIYQMHDPDIPFKDLYHDTSLEYVQATYKSIQRPYERGADKGHHYLASRFMDIKHTPKPWTTSVIGDRYPMNFSWSPKTDPAVQHYFFSDPEDLLVAELIL